ncbi:MAG TPA: VanW family protein [Symbiobacteriaceae bacterium]|jgi:hypothetical protein
MLSPRQIIIRGVIAGVLATVVGAGALFAYVHWYTGTDRIVPGVVVGDTPVGGLRTRDARHRLVSAGAGSRIAVSDLYTAVHQAGTLGRRGTVWQRTRFFLAGLIHGHRVPLMPGLRPEALPAGPIGPPAVPPDLPAPTGPLPPARRRRAAAPMRYQIARFATPILAADPGRVQNISVGIAKINGALIEAGQVFSFNERVGPRDAEHGWAQANEIYQGEFIMGYGGGICQVSSTLYNTVLLGGLEVTMRHHHDRPLQYVSPGRDATVAWNVLDFQFRNNADVPVLVGARLLPGSPPQIEVTLHAPRPVPADSVRLEEGERRYEPPVLEEIMDPALPAHVRKVIDEGRSGIEVKIYRIIRVGGNVRRELVSHDHYLAKPGKVRVGIGNAPGSERLLKPGIQ